VVAAEIDNEESRSNAGTDMTNRMDDHRDFVIIVIRNEWRLASCAKAPLGCPHPKGE